MTITLDVSAAMNGKAGLGRYASALAAAIAAEHPAALRLFANVSTSAVGSLLLPPVPLKTIRLGYKPWRMAVWLSQLAGLGLDSLLGETSLYHATEHLLMHLRHIPSVLTVHDLIYHLFPEHHRRLNYGYLKAAMPLYVRRAGHIITVSECTKRDLIRLYGTPAEKISVVYEAAAPHFWPQPALKVAEVKARYGLPARYLLTVGTLEPRKNLPRLVEALAALRRDDPALRLVVVGARGWLIESFFQAIERFDQRDGVILPGYIPDDDLPAIYTGSTVTVCASTYEGFGLPILEAMASGAPVACSTTSSLGEIAGEAALTFDPENTEAIIERLRSLATDGALRQALRTMGAARAAEFSWVRAAQETWAVYQQLIANRQ
jgi:glycosyltransferase involved in cell wall biosynthesis